MRRIPIATALLAALFLAAPSASVAHRHHHHAHRLGRSGRRHHTHARIERLSPPSPTAPAGEPAGDAGTVVSFEGGILKLRLANSSTVEGAVTSDTKIICAAEEATERTERAGEHDDGGDEGGAGGEWHGEGSQEGSPATATPTQERARASWLGGGDDGESDDEEPEEPSPSCGPSSLMKGAAVRVAELFLGPSGAVFRTIVLAG